MAGHPLRNTFTTSSHRQGFTIVELLIVIVVIGILAAITIVAFNGVSNKAKVSLVSSDLNGVSQKLKADLAINGAYPATLAAADNGKGVPASPGTTYQYTVDNTTNPPTFCITAVNGTNAYFITETGVPTAGTCPGDSATGTPTPPAPPAPVAPSIAGYYDFTSSTTMTGLTVPPAVPNGAWMIIIMAYNASADAVPPSGWTTLYSRITANTMQTMVFAKIKSSSDPATFSLTGSYTAATANGVLLWGTGAAGDITSWIKGTSANRNGTTAQQYTTTTPTLTTTAAQSLVLSVSTERTTATETDISSSTGATRWFFVPQPDANKIQTIFVSTATLASPGISTPVTVTYPNAQTTNGTAFQIALPPS